MALDVVLPGVEDLELGVEPLAPVGGPPIRLSGRPRGLRAPSGMCIKLRKAENVST